jgi:Na+-driven multidrug efflux pump
VGLSYVLGVLLNLGIFGCWIAFMLDEIAKSIVYLLRWRSGKFKKAIV